jgi:hypothetical protein
VRLGALLSDFHCGDSATPDIVRARCCRDRVAKRADETTEEEISMVRPDRGIRVKDLFGGRFLPEETVLQSMAPLEQRFSAEFHERSRLDNELAGHSRKASARLLEGSAGDAATAEAVAGLRSVAARLRAEELHVPEHVAGSERVYAGSFGAVLEPPYDYQWTWSATTGSPNDNRETANRETGRMSLVFDTGEDDPSSISGRIAVGSYFYPPAANGPLQVWASPAFSDLWYDICSWESCHADGWIGLFVQSYDLAGAPTGAVVDQQVSLWSDSSWYSGGSGRSSNSAFGLYAPPIQVDQDHQYIIWVWAGGYVSGQGWGTFSGSGAGDQLQITVPWLQWELG